MTSRSSDTVYLTECPRDAMQGIKEWIPTESKAHYINQLIKTGFDTIDFGSFVSPKAIPQMRDTAEVLEMLDLDEYKGSLLVIVANTRGAYNAVEHQAIDILGYPFSISETFQLRNTNATIEQSLYRVADIQSITIKNEKKLLIYISMGFGNPYGDAWNVQIVIRWVESLYAMGIRHISLSDTIGVSTPESIAYLFSNLIPQFPDMTIGAHLHTTPTSWREKVEAAYNAGCRHFDGAIMGYGGCPMAKDELTGNMPTERMVAYFKEKGALQNIKEEVFASSLRIAQGLFPH